MIVPDRLSDLVEKGELADRYYNPGDLFNEVHILLINDDRPDPAAIAPLVGDAELVVHRLPEGDDLFRRSLMWRPRLLRDWAAGGVRIAKRIRPALIRCHGAHLNALVASEIKRATGTPYMISMHTNPDEDMRRFQLAAAGSGWWRSPGALRGLLPFWASLGIEREGISHADCVACSYEFIVPYARRLGARRVEVRYNVVGARGLTVKEDYALSEPPRVVLPGRQVPGKDPAPVLDALAKLPGAELTLIGDGALHDALRAQAARLGIADRVEFIRSMPNAELCRRLAEYDVLISVNDHGGVSKVELEGALIGMPTITNAHPLEAEPEVLGSNCVVVAGDAASYEYGLGALLADEERREELGVGLREAAAPVRPKATEAAYVSLYRELAIAD